MVRTDAPCPASAPSPPRSSPAYRTGARSGRDHEPEPARAKTARDRATASARTRWPVLAAGDPAIAWFREGRGPTEAAGASSSRDQAAIRRPGTVETRAGLTVMEGKTGRTAVADRLAHPS